MVAVYMAVSAGLFLMAHWSHRLAGPTTDPGVLEWQHFRSEQDCHLHREDRKKWEDIRKSGQKVDLQPKVSESWDPEVVNEQQDQCLKCGSQKLDGVHHCSQCNRCVYKMDHHCPWTSLDSWTNNCVGYRTLKPFCLFLRV